MDHVTKKRLRDTDDDADGEDEEFNQQPKRHRSGEPILGRTGQGGKSGVDTYFDTRGPERLVEKKLRNDTDDDDEGDDDYYDDDYHGCNLQRSRSSRSRKKSLGPLTPKSNRTVAKIARYTKNSAGGNFSYGMGITSLGRARATNNPMSGYMGDSADTKTPATPQLSFSSSGTTGANLTASTPAVTQPSFSSVATAGAGSTDPTPADNTQAGSGGRKAQAWT
jgi:hypothetical protein